MRIKGLCLIFLALFGATPLPAGDDGAALTQKAGYALLDAFIKNFQEMAAKGSGDDVESRLLAMAAEAKRAKEAGEVNIVFYARYARILAMTKLFVQPDKGNILAPVINREVTAFLFDVTGEEPADFKAGGPRAVGQVANALAEELINLQIYLDTLDKRQAMRKKLDEGMTSPAK